MLDYARYHQRCSKTPNMPPFRPKLYSNKDQTFNSLPKLSPLTKDTTPSKPSLALSSPTTSSSMPLAPKPTNSSNPLNPSSTTHFLPTSPFMSASHAFPRTSNPGGLDPSSSI